MKITKREKILLILVIVIVLGIFIVKMVLDHNRKNINHGISGEYDIIYKKYGVNEYSSVSISDEQLANIYFNNFKYYLFNDYEHAYNLLEDSYRNAKFGSIDNFRAYVDGISYNDFLLSEFSISDSKRFIEVHISNGEKYIFKISSVLDYKVYLDDYTVEISVE